MSFRKPVTGPITQTFGADFQIDGRWYYKQVLGYHGHNGTDFAAAIGTPVYAADDGTVVFEGWGQNHGWMGTPAGICVLIHHGGTYGGYAHLNGTTVNKGQWVSKGQLIGYVGNTGAATGPHLHFEALPINPNFANGYAGRINPLQYMDAPINTASQEQVRQAFRDILQRDAEQEALNHYTKYTIDFVRSDLASSQEYRNLQARKAAAAQLAEQQRIAEVQRVQAEKRAKEEHAKREAERMQKEADEFLARQLKEAEEAKKRLEEEAAKPALVQPADGILVTYPSTPKPADPVDEHKPPQPNPIVRLLFQFFMNIFKKK